LTGALDYVRRRAASRRELLPAGSHQRHPFYLSAGARRNGVLVPTEPIRPGALAAVGIGTHVFQSAAGPGHRPVGGWALALCPRRRVSAARPATVGFSHGKFLMGSLDASHIALDFDQAGVMSHKTVKGDSMTRVQEASRIRCLQILL